jgi:hypothetical protein
MSDQKLDLTTPARVDLDELERELLTGIAAAESAGDNAVFAEAIIVANRQVLALIAELRAHREREASGGWVACSERIPEPRQYVIFQHPSWENSVGLGPYDPENQFRPWTDLTDVDMCGDANHMSDYEVSHWMPLPAPPAVKEPT